MSTMKTLQKHVLKNQKPVRKTPAEEAKEKRAKEQQRQEELWEALQNAYNAIAGNSAQTADINTELRGIVRRTKLLEAKREDLETEQEGNLRNMAQIRAQMKPVGAEEEEGESEEIHDLNPPKTKDNVVPIKNGKAEKPE